MHKMTGRALHCIPVLELGFVHAIYTAKKNLKLRLDFLVILTCSSGRKVEWALIAVIGDARI